MGAVGCEKTRRVVNLSEGGSLPNARNQRNRFAEVGATPSRTSQAPVEIRLGVRSTPALARGT
jgi:hypothetical protein